MTGPEGRLRSATMLQSYWQASRAHRYSLAFALPLLALYETLAALVPHEPGIGVRNGADVILRTFFFAVAGAWGPLLFEVSLIGFGCWLVLRDVRRHGAGLHPCVFAGMLTESALLALAFGTVVGAATRLVLSPLTSLAAPAAETLDWWTRLMVSLGAGLYEELLFRVVLVAALAYLGRRVFGWRPLIAGVAATLVSALVFSAYHYIGPYGDQLRLPSFVFRLIGGLFFSALYLLRGFGITEWTHALYGVFLLAV